MRMRECVADSDPADFKEMPSRCGGRGLAVDHEHFQLRERLGMTAQHHLRQPIGLAGQPITFALYSPIAVSDDCGLFLSFLVQKRGSGLLTRPADRDWQIAD